MPSHVLKGALLALAGLGLLAAPARAQTWQVTQVTGQFWFASPNSPAVTLTRASLVPDGATVMTGPTGRAVLARGAETISLSPNSALALPAPDQGRTTVLQRAGEIAFDVEKRNVPHFAVETPHLAAVVKGTAFTVKVGELEASVNVERGQVEVTDFFTGESADIVAGQNASVEGTFSRLTVGGPAPRPELRQGVPRSPMVAALAFGEGGLQPTFNAPAPVRGGAVRASPPAAAASTAAVTQFNVAPAPDYLAQVMPATGARPSRAPDTRAFENLVRDSERATDRQPNIPAGDQYAAGVDAAGVQQHATADGELGGPGAAVAGGLSQLTRMGARAGSSASSFLNQRTYTEDINVPPTLIAALIAAAALLAVGFAFVRARFG